MGIKVAYKRKSKKYDLKLVIQNRPFIDTIIEITPILMQSSDSLQVTYDLIFEGYVNNTLTSVYPEKFSYIFELNKSLEVKYIRFTKHNDKASIQIYENMPNDCYKPPKWNAKKLGL